MKKKTHTPSVCFACLLCFAIRFLFYFISICSRWHEQKNQNEWKKNPPRIKIVQKNEQAQSATIYVQNLDPMGKTEHSMVCVCWCVFCGNLFAIQRNRNFKQMNSFHWLTHRTKRRFQQINSLYWTRLSVHHIHIFTNTFYKYYIWIGSQHEFSLSLSKKSVLNKWKNNNINKTTRQPNKNEITFKTKTQK